jgi:hypothetical protein
MIVFTISSTYTGNGHVHFDDPKNTAHGAGSRPGGGR